MIMGNKVSFEDEVRGIFNHSSIKKIESDILDLYQESERRHFRYDSYQQISFAIKRLLKIRKNLLDEGFILNEASKQLLKEFNDALKNQLEEMWQRTIALEKKVIDLNTLPDPMATGKCFLGYNYSKIHPVQTIRAKKMWAMLNGSLDHFEPLYNDGVANSFIVQSSINGLEYQSCNQMLYLEEEPDNWNEGLDPELTKDLHLIYPFHNLWEHMYFSIFDLLWVRDFDIELSIEIDYSSYSGDYDDLDWRKYDYYESYP